MAFGLSKRSLKLFFKRNRILRRTLPMKVRQEALNDLYQHRYKGISKYELDKKLMRDKWLRPNDGISDNQAWRIRNELVKKIEPSHSSIEQSSSRDSLSEARAQHARETAAKPPETRPSLMSRFNSAVSQKPTQDLSNPKSTSRPSLASRFKSNPRPGSISPGRRS